MRPRPRSSRRHRLVKLPFTYPPITLAPFAGLSVVSRDSALYLINCAGLAALGLVVWLILGMLGHRPSLGRLGATLGATGLRLWTEPVTHTSVLGQINLFVTPFYGRAGLESRGDHDIHEIPDDLLEARARGGVH